MSADHEGALGRYYPKPGDRLLGEHLIMKDYDPNNVLVDQVEIDIEELNGDRAKVKIKVIGEDAKDRGSEYRNEGPISDLMHLRCGLYEITKRLDEPQRAGGIETDWRSLSRLHARGILGT